MKTPRPEKGDCVAKYGDCDRCGMATFHAFKSWSLRGPDNIANVCIFCQSDDEKVAATWRHLDLSKEEGRELESRDVKAMHDMLRGGAKSTATKRTRAKNK